MKKFYLLLLFAVTGLISCHQDEFEDYNMSQQAVLIPDSMLEVPVVSIDGGDSMTLGNRLENPYSVANMRRAYNSMVPELVDAGIESDDITTTHFYVKFKPDNEEELQSIKESYADFDIYEYPLDYEMNGRVSYHDPEIPDSLPTYQYASIDSLSWTTIPVPQNVEVEILERLFIPDEDINDTNLTVQSCGATSYNDAIEALVNRSLLLTGNLDDEEMLEDGTMSSSSKWYPSGRITAYDDILDAQVPLEGVKVRVRRWFTTSTATTDENGYFTISKGFKNKVNYLIVWEGPKWDIRDGLIAQAYYNGPKKQGAWNLNITDDGHKSIRYAAIHRAVYRMKHGNTYGISRINNFFTTKICYIHNSFSNITGMYWLEVGAGVLPDIFIFGKSENSNKLRKVHEIISTTFHELGHASHFTNAPLTYAAINMRYIESWASFVGYYLVLKEYQDLGYSQGPFTSYMVTGANHESIIYHKPDTYMNRQLTQIGNTDYTPLFIDLYDNDNQWRLYDYYTNHADNLNRELLPKDYIRSVPANILENFVFNSSNLSQIKTKLMYFCWGNTPEINEVYNLSIDNINLMFDLYEE